MNGDVDRIVTNNNRRQRTVTDVGRNCDGGDIDEIVMNGNWDGDGIGR
jgi:hypothetical protein